MAEIVNPCPQCGHARSYHTMKHHGCRQCGCPLERYQIPKTPQWVDPAPWLSKEGSRGPQPYAQTPGSGWKHKPRTKDRYDLEEALDVLAHIVAQANVNPVIGEDAAGEFITRYDMPVGSIHKAIPFLARHGIVVGQYGYVHRVMESAPKQAACSEFKWPGQPLLACKECGAPFWEHTTYMGKPITPEQASAEREKWL